MAKPFFEDLSSLPSWEDLPDPSGATPEVARSLLADQLSKDELEKKRSEQDKKLADSVPTTVVREPAKNFAGAPGLKSDLPPASGQGAPARQLPQEFLQAEQARRAALAAGAPAESVAAAASETGETAKQSWLEAIPAGVSTLGAMAADVPFGALGFVYENVGKPVAEAITGTKPADMPEWLWHPTATMHKKFRDALPAMPDEYRAGEAAALALLPKTLPYVPVLNPQGGEGISALPRVADKMLSEGKTVGEAMGLNPVETTPQDYNTAFASMQEQARKALDDPQYQIDLYQGAEGSKVAINAGALYEKLRAKFLIKQEIVPGVTTDQEQIALEAAADEYANREITKIIQTGFGLPFVWRNDEAALDYVMSLPAPVRPFVASLMPYNVVRQQGNVLESQWDQFGSFAATLNYFDQATSLTPMVSAALETGNLTDEAATRHLLLDKDITDAWVPLTKKLADSQFVSERSAQWASGLIVGGIILADAGLDPVLRGVAVVGKGAKGVKRSIAIQQATHIASALDEAADAVEAGQSIDKVQDALYNKAPGAAGVMTPAIAAQIHKEFDDRIKGNALRSAAAVDDALRQAESIKKDYEAGVFDPAVDVKPDAAESPIGKEARTAFARSDARAERPEARLDALRGRQHQKLIELQTLEAEIALKRKDEAAALDAIRQYDEFIMQHTPEEKVLPNPQKSHERAVKELAAEEERARKHAEYVKTMLPKKEEQHEKLVQREQQIASLLQRRQQIDSDIKLLASQIAEQNAAIKDAKSKRANIVQSPGPFTVLDEPTPPPIAKLDEPAPAPTPAPSAENLAEPTKAELAVLRATPASAVVNNYKDGETVVQITTASGETLRYLREASQHSFHKMLDSRKDAAIPGPDDQFRTFSAEAAVASQGAEKFEYTPAPKVEVPKVLPGEEEAPPVVIGANKVADIQARMQANSHIRREKLAENTIAELRGEDVIVFVDGLTLYNHVALNTTSGKVPRNEDLQRVRTKFVAGSKYEAPVIFDSARLKDGVFHLDEMEDATTAKEIALLGALHADDRIPVIIRGGSKSQGEKIVVRFSQPKGSVSAPKEPTHLVDFEGENIYPRRDQPPATEAPKAAPAPAPAPEVKALPAPTKLVETPAASPKVETSPPVASGPAKATPADEADAVAAGNRRINRTLNAKEIEALNEQTRVAKTAKADFDAKRARLLAERAELDATLNKIPRTTPSRRQRLERTIAGIKLKTLDIRKNLGEITARIHKIYTEEFAKRAIKDKLIAEKKLRSEVQRELAAVQKEIDKLRERYDAGDQLANVDMQMQIEELEAYATRLRDSIQFVAAQFNDIPKLVDSTNDARNRIAKTYRNAAQELRRYTGHAPPEPTAHAILALENDPVVPSKTWQTALNKYVSNTMRVMGNPIAYRIGSMAEDAQHVTRGMENNISHIDQLLAEHLRNANKEQTAAVIEFISEQIPNNWLLTGTSLWQELRTALLHNIAWEEAQGIAKGERAKAEAFVKSLNTTQKIEDFYNEMIALAEASPIYTGSLTPEAWARQMLEDQLKLIDETRDELKRTPAPVGVGHAGTQDGALIEARQNPALEALAFAWLPRGVPTGDPAMRTALIKHVGTLLATPEITFETFMAKMKDFVEANNWYGDSDDRWQRVILHAARATSAGVMFDRAVKELGTIGKKIDAVQAHSMAAVASGRNDEIIDFESAMRGWQQLDIPFKQVKESIQWKREMTRELVAYGGEYIPASIVHRARDSFKKLIKTDEAFNPDAGRHLPRSVENAFNRYNHLFLRSLTSGLILPNPSHYVNNAVQNIGSIYTHVGVRAGAQATRSAVFSMIPGFDKIFAPAAAQLADYARARGAERLPFAIDAMFDRVTHNILTQQDGNILLPDGPATFKQLYQEAATEGMFSNFASEELLEAERQIMSTADATMGRLISGQKYAELSATMDTRQRVSLFVDLRRRGASAKEAGKIARGAVYDWRHGAVLYEILPLTKFIPFARFHELALRQTANILFEPFTNPDKVLREGSKVGRVMAAHRTAVTIGKGMTHLLSPDEDEDRRALTEYDTLLHQNAFQGARVLKWGSPIDEQNELFYNSVGRYGKTRVYSLPNMTEWDFIPLMLSIPFGLSLAASAGTNGDAEIDWRALGQMMSMPFAEYAPPIAEAFDSPDGYQTVSQGMYYTMQALDSGAVPARPHGLHLHRLQRRNRRAHVQGQRQGCCSAAARSVHGFATAQDDGRNRG